MIANPALARIYGYDSPEEMIESITDLAGQVYADPEERQAFTRAMEEEGGVKGYELQLKAKRWERPLGFYECPGSPEMKRGRSSMTEGLS